MVLSLPIFCWDQILDFDVYQKTLTYGAGWDKWDLSPILDFLWVHSAHKWDLSPAAAKILNMAVKKKKSYFFS